MVREPVGFVGLGDMGAPMARNLVDAGFDVIAYNRSQAPLEAFVAEGGRRASSPAAVGAEAQVVITCLSTTAVVTDLVTGPGGIVEGTSGGETVIDTSTISPAAAQRLARELDAVDVHALDAPISGGVEGAKAGTLSIMVGGDAAVLEAVRPVLEAIGETITHCGSSGAGQATKACNQLVIANTLEILSEALVFAAAFGADPEAVVAALRGGTADSWVLRNRATQMVDGDFDGAYLAPYLSKDLDLALEAAEAHDLSMPLASAARDLYASVLASDDPADDAAVMRVVEELADARRDR